MSCEIRQIDGSILEGGGQILRIALTLAVIKKIPVRITKIRAGRKNPGLREQHLKGVELLRDLSNAKVKGAALSSTEIEFWPGEIQGGQYEAQIRTAGSISLLLQAALPCCLFANGDISLRLHGGTNADLAPQIDYTTEVVRPNLEKFGASFDLELLKRGYFPKGGGLVSVDIKQGSLKGTQLIERGEISSIFGWSFVAGTLPIKLAHSMAGAAAKELKKFNKNVQIERYKEDYSIAPENCSGIILVAETTTGCFLGGSALGKRGETADNTGKRAALELGKSLEEGACVDEHTQDQIVVFMALAEGPSNIRVGEITLHTKTAIFIAEEMTNAKFEIVPDGSTNLIKCSGAQ